MSVLLAARDLHKSFGPNEVLCGIDFELHPGRVMALCGENGAGKSTLIKLLTGLYEPTAGHVEYLGEAVSWKGPAASLAAGISVVHQEFSTLPGLTVAENVFLEAPEMRRFGLLDRRRMLRDTAALLERLGIGIDPRTPVGRLSVAEAQMVEIAKALRGNARVLILDEPTAVLSGPEVEQLFGIVGRLRGEGLGLMYVSHRLDEIFEICTDITVLKDGDVTRTGPVEDFDHDSVVAAMVGRELGELFPPKADPERLGDTCLEVHGLRREGSDHPIDLTVRHGEIAGLAGLVGAGRTEIAEAVYGLRDATGTVRVGGRERHRRSPRESIDNGISMVTENRKFDGIFPETQVALNFTASTLGQGARAHNLPAAHDTRRAESLVEEFGVLVNDTGLPIKALSGGNQQKVLVARALENTPSLLILDEPTRGVDVGAKADIYRRLRALANDGMAILVISSELIEVVGLCDRVHVIRDGERVAELEGEAITENEIIAAAAASGPLTGGQGHG